MIQREKNKAVKEIIEPIMIEMGFEKKFYIEDGFRIWEFARKENNIKQYISLDDSCRRNEIRMTLDCDATGQQPVIMKIEKVREVEDNWSKNAGSDVQEVLGLYISRL